MSEHKRSSCQVERAAIAVMRPGAQEFEFSPGSLELVGMRVAPHQPAA